MEWASTMRERERREKRYEGLRYLTFERAVVTATICINVLPYPHQWRRIIAPREAKEDPDTVAVPAITPLPLQPATPQRGARTRSRTRQALEQGQGPPLLGVVNNPVAPTPPPAQQDRRGDPPPSPEPNIRQDLREQEPVVPELPNEQQLGDPLQNQPDLPLNDPLQNQPDLPLNDPLQNQPDLPLNDPLQNQPDLPLNNPLQNQPDLPLNNMAARFPPAMQSWEAFTQALIAIRPPLPEYSGLDYEDPDRYLTKCQEYVTALQLPEGSRLAVLEKGLKGAAEKWWQSYKPMNLSFDRFSEYSEHNSIVSRLRSSSGQTIRNCPNRQRIRELLHRLATRCVLAVTKVIVRALDALQWPYHCLVIEGHFILYIIPVKSSKSSRMFSSLDFLSILQLGLPLIMWKRTSSSVLCLRVVYRLLSGCVLKKVFYIDYSFEVRKLLFWVWRCIETCVIFLYCQKNSHQSILSFFTSTDHEIGQRILDIAIAEQKHRFLLMKSTNKIRKLGNPRLRLSNHTLRLEQEKFVFHDEKMKIKSEINFNYIFCKDCFLTILENLLTRKHQTEKCLDVAG
ncbi:unnamed protein product, partial [Trichogramma brassicae]